MFCTELFRQGFIVGTWNFFEANHGKRDPDAVGGALKRRADSLVSKGTDILDATELFAVLQKTERTIKFCLFFVNEESVKKAVSDMPNDVPPVPSIMRMHQAVTLSYGELTYRYISCLCMTTQHLNSECFNTKRFTFSHQQTAPTASTGTEVQWQSPKVVGKWCVLKYDGDLYPGVVTEVKHILRSVVCRRLESTGFSGQPRKTSFGTCLRTYHPTPKASHRSSRGD